VGHGAGAVDQHADLPPCLSRQLGELPRKFLGDQAIGGNLPPEEAFELSDLARLQPMGIAEDADGPTLPSAVDPQGNLRNAAAATQPSLRAPLGEGGYLS
jgi:hypothetical protein